MQADGRLIEDVADAEEMAAQVRRQPGPLDFAAGKRRRRAVEREIAESHLLQKAKAMADLGDQSSPHAPREEGRSPINRQVLRRRCCRARPCMAFRLCNSISVYRAAPFLTRSVRTTMRLKKANRVIHCERRDFMYTLALKQDGSNFAP